MATEAEKIALWERWKQFKGSMSPEEFIRHYNKNHKTTFSAKSLTLVEAKYGQGTQPGTQPGTTPGTTPGEGGTPEQRDAFVVLRDILDGYGLGTLAPWVWDEIKKGTPESTIFIKLRDTPEYKKRFPGMQRLKEQGWAISEDEYLNMEKQYSQIMKSMGVPEHEFDNPSDFKVLFDGLVSPSELQERAQIWNQITKAPNTTARLRGLFKEYGNIANVTDEDLYKIMLGVDEKVTQEYAAKTGTPYNLATIQNTMQRALMEEESSFRGGGGNIQEDRAGKVGLMEEDQAY